MPTDASNTAQSIIELFITIFPWFSGTNVLSL